MPFDDALSAVLFDVEDLLVDPPSAAIRATPADDATARELLALRADRALDEALARGARFDTVARDALLALAARTRLAVVSRASLAVAERALALVGLDGAVALTVARDGAAPASPIAHVRAIARLARVRPLAAARVVAIESTIDGAIAARDAGLCVVGAGETLRDHAARDRADTWLASVAHVTYDALVALVANRGARSA